MNFKGDGTVSIRDDYNVSSIGDNGTGLYTVNFSSGMGNTNYCVVVGGYNANDGGGGWNTVSPQGSGNYPNGVSSGNFKMGCYRSNDGAQIDQKAVYVAVFS